MNAHDQTLAQPAVRVPLAGRTLLRLARNLRCGTLHLTLPGGEHRVFTGRQTGPSAHLVLRDWGAARSILSAADVGLARCYRDGLVDVPDLTALLALGIHNDDALGPAFRGGPVVRRILRVLHALRRNTRAGSRRNIHAHYDLGNDFYAQWLDPGMAYSSALYGAASAGCGLEQAQVAKYDRILDRLDLKPDHHVLEIGCGWGGFAERAARTRGCRVTAITVSQAQYDYAVARMRDAGLADRVTVLLSDYRDVAGRFDRIASIEMFEAVGQAYWPAWFRCLARCLAPGGRAVIQTITLDEAAFGGYVSGSDFIREFIFPGGMLPTPGRFVEHARAARLDVVGRFDFGRDYARTLRAWRDRFEAALPAIRRLGFDESFVRIWRFYYAYCEAGFDAGRTDVTQFELAHAAQAPGRFR